MTLTPVDNYSNIRQDIVNYFDNLETFCVGIEKHKTTDNYHLHMYLKFYNDCDCLFVRNYLDWFEGSINIEPCRSARNWLKYVTKEDSEAYFNFSVDQLLFYCRLHFWARKTESFRYSDPFVVEHLQKAKFLQEFHNEVRMRMVRGQKVFHRMERINLGWPMEVALWWNRVISSDGDYKKTLYLHGIGGVGKSYLIERLVG